MNLPPKLQRIRAVVPIRYWLWGIFLIYAMFADSKNRTVEAKIGQSAVAIVFLAFLPWLMFLPLRRKLKKRRITKEEEEEAKVSQIQQPVPDRKFFRRVTTVLYPGWMLLGVFAVWAQFQPHDYSGAKTATTNAILGFFLLGVLPSLLLLPYRLEKRERREEKKALKAKNRLRMKQGIKTREPLTRKAQLDKAIVIGGYLIAIPYLYLVFKSFIPGLAKHLTVSENPIGNNFSSSGNFDQVLVDGLKNTLVSTWEYTVETFKTQIIGKFFLATVMYSLLVRNFQVALFLRRKLKSRQANQVA